MLRVTRHLVANVEDCDVVALRLELLKLVLHDIETRVLVSCGDHTNWERLII